MLAAGKWVTSVVVGGILLGALLGSAADPTIKDPPKQWWQLTGRDSIADDQGEEFAAYDPGAFSPFGGFRPDLDYDSEVWALPIPAEDLAYLSAQPDPFAETRAQPDAPTETAATAAQAAVDEIADAPAPPVEARKPELAADGIY